LIQLAFHTSLETPGLASKHTCTDGWVSWGWWVDLGWCLHPTYACSFGRLLSHRFWRLR